MVGKGEVYGGNRGGFWWVKGRVMGGEKWEGYGWEKGEGIVKGGKGGWLWVGKGGG